MRAWAGEDADLVCVVRRHGNTMGNTVGNISIIWLRDTEEPGAEQDIIAHNDRILYQAENKFRVNMTRSGQTSTSTLTVSC